MLGLALLSAVLASCDSRNPFSPPTLEPLEVDLGGRWMRDRKGRVVLLRGVSLSSLEPGRWFGSRGGEGERDFQLLQDLGTNVVRIPLTWSFLEPRPGYIDAEAVIEHVDPVVRSAAAHGMTVILGMEQYRWSTCFVDGFGAPSWVCVRRNYPNDAQGWAQAACDFWKGEKAPDGRTLREHFIDAWRHVAMHYAVDGRIVGFDLFDAPDPEGCMPPDQFKALLFEPFRRELEAAIRDAKSNRPIFFQPMLSREAPLPERVEPLTPPTAYAPHLYTQTFGPPPGSTPESLPALYDTAARQAGELGVPLFLGAFGGDGELVGAQRQTTVPFLNESLAQMDRLRVGGTFRDYDPKARQLTIVGPDGQHVVSIDALAWPFARRIAGIPTEMSFDPKTREFVLRFDDDPERSPPDPSEIFLPKHRLYKRGFAVEVSDGSWRFDEHTQRLLVYRGSASSHEVRVRPQTMSVLRVN